jgi:replication factor C subunit 3/5
MPLLIDEFTPQHVEDIFFHKDIYTRLKKMSRDGSIPHIVFHGAPGSGKRTMMSLFLKMIYGDTVSKLYSTSYNIAGSGKKTKKEFVQNSSRHIIINPTGTNFDKYLVHEIVKRYASTNTYELTVNPYSKFKTIQISNLDNLSHSAQTALRRMIETNANVCRFIMWCDNLGNIIGPLKSRCVCIRVPRPTEIELFRYLTYIAGKKSSDVSISTVKKIVKYSDCDIKRALWCMHHAMLGFDHKTNYDKVIEKMTLNIKLADLQNIENIRDDFFHVWITNFTGVRIVKDILCKILAMTDINDETKTNIIIKTAEIEYNILRSRRVIIHFDHFVVSMMKFFDQSNRSMIDKNKTINTKVIKNTKS